MRHLIPFLFLFFGCNYKQKVLPSTQAKTYTFTVQLPFESSNYGTTVNFFLNDSSGKRCIPSLDTVTKGGGTVEYQNLPGGIYSYTINTVMDETITRQIRIDSSQYLNFYDACYNVSEAIEEDSIVKANVIKLIIEDSSASELYTFIKTTDKYKVQTGFRPYESKPFFIDSALFIKSIIDLQSSALGLRKINVSEKDYPPYISTAMYLKCDNQLLQIFGTRETDFHRICKRFKQTIVK